MEANWYSRGNRSLVVAVMTVSMGQVPNPMAGGTMPGLVFSVSNRQGATHGYIVNSAAGSTMVTGNGQIWGYLEGFFWPPSPGMRFRAITPDRSVVFECLVTDASARAAPRPQAVARGAPPRMAAIA